MFLNQKKTFASFLFFHLLFYSFQGNKERPVAVRSINWEDVVRNERLSGTKIAKLFHVSSAHCAFRCGRIPHCRSFNYCRSQICELNSDDVFSIGADQFRMEHSRDCFYQGMLRNDMPNCMESRAGTVKDIRDNYPGYCQINQKRVDRKWSSWERIKVDNSTDYIISDRREMIKDYAHGGEVGSDDKKRVHQWLRWVRVDKSWPVAKQNCQDLGGKLFSNVNGTKEQLEFLIEKLDISVHWLGIYREMDSTAWITTDGVTVSADELFWKPGNVQPKMDNSHRYVTNYDKNLHSGDAYQPVASVCDMLV